MPTASTVKKKKLVKASTAKKQLTRFRPRIRSRHPSHSPLRSQLPLLPFRSIVRLGSTTVENDQHRLIECNTIQAVQNSANKLRMKRCFDRGHVVTAKWADGHASVDGILNTMGLKEWQPIVSKSLTGSRGRGNRLHNTRQELERFLNEHRNDIGNYIFEKYYDYVREYRLHVTKDGCFYACRKMLRSDTPEHQRWYRNDSNCTWIVEENPDFDKPVNWNTIIGECVKALNAVGLDIGACDVKVQSAQDKKGNARKSPEFIVIEINSAPSFGDTTLLRYLERIPIVLQAKKSAA